MTTRQRLSFEQGLDLFQNASLEELCQQAQEVRNEKHGTKHVTFILDSNPNYTNVCYADCSFCGFYRHKQARDAYTETIDEVMQHFAKARAAGCVTVLLQGGLNKDLKIDYYEELVERAVTEYPDVYLHGFSAPEIWHIAEVSNLSIREVLQRLWDKGLRSVPGGGAEILSERVRLEVSPKKMGPDVWITVHKIAHELGYKTTATMMYGHVETAEDVLIHLDTIRSAQDCIPGFTAFIPWSYKRDRTALRRKVQNWAGRDAYLRMIAFSRIYLDNIPHIQASWFSEGKEIGIAALHAGADDFGGIILEENVHKAVGHVHHVDCNQVLSMIREAGYTPAQRDTFYNILKEYQDEEVESIPEAQKVTQEDQLLTIGKHLELASCGK